jgi:AmmeMemoRadiSam system protein A
VTGRLSQDERRILLGLARASLRQKLTLDRSLDRELERIEMTPPLREARGAFVTLKRPTEQGREALRGCIGSMTGRQPLYRAVIDLVRKSAFEDPRFPAMTGDELPAVRIEISVLTPLRDVSGHEEIVIGRHGVQLQKGTAGAVFLPQVAVEHGWSLEQLLSQLALKAGLGEADWRGGKLSVFEAEVFGEPQPGS